MREAIAWKQGHARAPGALDVDSPQDEEAALSHKINVLKETTSSLLKEVESLRETIGEAETFRKIVLNIGHGIDFYDEVRRFETELIRRALEQTGGNQSRAANLLRLKLTTLNEMIKRYQLLEKKERAGDEAVQDEQPSAAATRALRLKLKPAAS